MIGPIRAYEIDKVRKEIVSKVLQNDMGNFAVPMDQAFLQQRGEGNYNKIFGVDEGHKVLGIYNDFGCRSDDFKKDHEGKLHILYAGCSITYAEGLPIEYGWAKIVNNYIHNNIAETSGYFNVAKCGINFHVMLNQIIGYMKYAGKPDVIFLLLPEIGREYLEYETQMWAMNKDELQRPDKDEDPITLRNFHERLINLKSICDLMDIKLVLGCWAMNINNYIDITKHFKPPFVGLDVINVAGKAIWLQDFREHNLNYPEIEKEIIDSLDPHDPLRKMVYLALDDAHPGLLGQRIIAHHFIEHIKKSDIFHIK